MFLISNYLFFFIQADSVKYFLDDVDRVGQRVRSSSLIPRFLSFIDNVGNWGWPT